MPLHTSFSRLRTTKGVSITSYVLVGALILLVGVGALLSTGETIRSLFTGATLSLNTPVASSSPTIAGQPAPPPVASIPDTPLFVAGYGDAPILDTTTSLLLNVDPISAQGDVLAAVVMHRSTLTPPMGWTEVVSHKASGTQWTTLLTKSFTSTDMDGVQFTQATPDRFLGQILTIRGTDPVVAAFTGQNGNTEPAELSPFFGAHENGVAIAAMSDRLALTGTSLTTITPSSGWTQTTPESAINNRLAITHRSFIAGEGGQALMGPTFADNASTDDWAGIVVQFTPRGETQPLSGAYNAYPEFADPRLTVLTPQDDTYTLTSAEIGVIALAGNDTLTGTNANELFIPGPGTDIAQGRGGNDTYIFYRGDESLTITEGSNEGAVDILRFMNYEAQDLVFLNTSDDDLLITGEGLDGVTLVNQFATSTQVGIESIVLLDTTLDKQAIRNKTVADMKPTGTVLGTDYVEQYFHAPGDGSYVITDYHYSANLTDSLTLQGVNQDDVTFVQINNSLQITHPTSGDVITIVEMFSSSKRYLIEQIIFADGVLNDVAVRAKMTEDMKTTGSVVGTELPDVYFYESGDGSYTISDYDYWANHSDRLNMIGLNADDVRFTNLGTDLRIDNLLTGEVVTIDRMFDGSRRYQIEEIMFDNGLLNDQAIRNKTMEDMKPSGAVLGTEFPDQYTYTPGDGTYTITDYHYWANNTDTLTLVGVYQDDVTFFNDNETLRITHLATGDILSVYGMFQGTNRYRIEQLVFADGILNDALVREKTFEDMKPTGTVVGTEHADTYRYAPGDGSYTITDYHYWANRTDQLVMEGVASNDVVFFNDNETLRITHMATGDVLRLHLALSGQNRYRIEEIVFTDTTLTDSTIRAKTMHDMKPTGQVLGTEHADTYTHTSGEGSYTITDYHYWGNRTDVLTFTDLATTDIVFSRDGTTLVMDLPGSETVRVHAHFNTNNRHRIEQFVFTDVSWSAQDLATATP